MKDHFKSVFVYGVSNALSSLVIILLVPFYTRFFSVSQFGVYDFYASLNLLIFIIFESQMISGFMRYYYDSKKEGSTSQLFSSIITFYLFSIIIAAAFIYFFVVLWSNHFPILNWYYFVPILVGLFPAQIYELYLVYIRMEGQKTRYLVYNVAQAVITFVFALFFVFILKLGILGAITGLIISKTVLMIPALIDLRRSYSLKFRFFQMRNLLFYCIPQLPTVVFSWFQSSFSRFFIIYFLGSYMLGIYGLIMKIGLVIALALKTFRLVWGPYCMRLFTHPDVKYAKKMIANSLDLYVYIGYIFVFLIAMLTPVFFIVFSPKVYWHYFCYSEFVVLALFVQGATNITSMGNDWVKKTYYNTLAFFCGVLASYTLLWCYIKQYQLLAIFISFFAGVMIINLITLITSQKNQKIEYKKITLLMLYLFSLIILSLLAMLLLENQMTIYLYEEINLALLVIVSALLLLFLLNHKSADLSTKSLRGL